MMARPKSADRKAAIVEATIAAVAELGLAAPTTLIAKRASVAHGSVFAYFDTKAALFNAVYVQLKAELDGAVFDGLPVSADTREQLHRLWTGWARWGVSNPVRRRALAQLEASDLITAESRAVTLQGARIGVEVFRRAGANGALRDQSIEFISGFFHSLAGTTVDFMVRDPARAEAYSSAGFEALWNALTQTAGASAPAPA